MARKLKNLNKDSKRQYLLMQKEMIEKELQEVPELFQHDLLDLLSNYERSLVVNEFAANTRKKYIRNAKWFIDHYATDETPIAKDDVINFKSYVQDTYDKISTINSYITTVNRFLFFCDLGDLKVTKVKGQGRNTLPHRIYEHEYKRMWMKARSLRLMDLYLVLRLMGETGVRVNEINAFTDETIQKKSVSVDNKAKIREVPIPEHIRYELRRYAKDQKIKGEIVKISYKEIYNGLKDLAGLCKIKKSKIHPHAFRHYFGFSFTERNGESSLAQLSDIMGHGSVETTRIYTRGTLDDYLKKMEKRSKGAK